MISFKCPSCAKSVKVEESSQGKKGKCPGCGAIVRIPHLTLSAATVETPEAIESVAAPSALKQDNTEVAPAKSSAINAGVDFAVNLAFEKLNGYLPAIKEFVRQKAGQITNKLSDDRLRIILDLAYEAVVPFPLKYVISKDTFIKYCMENRQQLEE